MPSADIEFYATRLKNLEGIYSQLRDPRVKRMAHYLEDTHSVYLDCFKTMLTNIVAGMYFIMVVRSIIAYYAELNYRNNFRNCWMPRYICVPETSFIPLWDFWRQWLPRCQVACSTHVSLYWTTMGQLQILLQCREAYTYVYFCGKLW